MPDSIRKQKIDALVALFETITVGNGYSTDIGLKITKHRTTDVQKSDMPGGDLRAGQEDKKPRGGNHICTLEIELELNAFGDDPAGALEDAIADVTIAVGTSIPSSLSQLTTPVNTDPIELDQADRKVGSVLCTFSIQYVTAAFQPLELAS